MKKLLLITVMFLVPSIWATEIILLEEFTTIEERSAKAFGFRIYCIGGYKYILGTTRDRRSIANLVPTQMMELLITPTGTSSVPMTCLTSEGS